MLAEMHVNSNGFIMDHQMCQKHTHVLDTCFYLAS